MLTSHPSRKQKPPTPQRKLKNSYKFDYPNTSCTLSISVNESTNIWGNYFSYLIQCLQHTIPSHSPTITPHNDSKLDSTSAIFFTSSLGLSCYVIDKLPEAPPSASFPPRWLHTKVPFIVLDWRVQEEICCLCPSAKLQFVPTFMRSQLLWKDRGMSDRSWNC